MTDALIRYPTRLPYPFAKAVSANGFLFVSGQVSMHDDGTPWYGDVATQTHRILHTLQQTLAECGATLQEVVKVTVWLSDMAHFAAFNQVYQTYFSQGFPARSVVSSQLAFGLDVEIEVQACPAHPEPSHPDRSLDHAAAY